MFCSFDSFSLNNDTISYDTARFSDEEVVIKGVKYENIISSKYKSKIFDAEIKLNSGLYEVFFDKNVSIIIDTLYNKSVSLFMVKGDLGEVIFPSNLSGKSLSVYFINYNKFEFYPSQNDVYIRNSSFQYMKLAGADSSYLLIQSSTIGDSVKSHLRSNRFVYVDFIDTQFKSGLHFFDNKIENLNIKNCEFNNKLTFFYNRIHKIRFTKLTKVDTIKFTKNTFENEVDISKLYSDSGPVNLMLDVEAAKNVKFKRGNFKLVFDDDDNDIDKHYYDLEVYENLLTTLKKNYYYDSYFKIFRDKERYRLTKNPNKSKVLGYVLFFINDNLTGFGGDKLRAIKSTFWVFLFFFFFNLIFFKYLQFKVYSIDSIDTAMNGTQLHFRYRLFYSLMFSLFIFFGLKIDLKNLKLNRAGGVSYILFQFIVGLVCLAFIAENIVSSGKIF